MRRYLAGIDGGQSSTTAVIGDEAGRFAGRGRAGPADEIGAVSGSTRLHDAMRDALADACSNAGLPCDTQFAAIVAGLSGYEGRVYGKPPALPTRRFVLLHDGAIAHAGALGGQPGIVVVAGTGSVVYATDGASEWSGGGWGYLFGDEGSAFWVARETLAALMQRGDQGACNEELQAARDFFGLPTLRGIARAFYAGEISRERLAAFAPAALRFPLGRSIADRGADRLAALVCSALEAGMTPTIAFVGGMFADSIFTERLTSIIRKAMPVARIVKPQNEPSIGALALAYREAGLGPFAEVRD